MGSKKVRVVFTTEEEEILIDYVKTNECLYNPHHELYKNPKNRTVLWMELAKMINKTGQDCMKKWATFRDYHTRVRGKAASTGTVSKFTRKRIEQLSFLERISNGKRSTISNVSATQEGETQILDESQEAQTTQEYDWQMEDISNSTESPMNSPSSPGYSPAFDDNVRKRRRVDPASKSLKKHSMERTTLLKQMLHCKKRPLSGLEHFFAGICDSVGKLPPIRQAELKIEIAALVGKAEIAALKAQIEKQQDVIYCYSSDYSASSNHQSSSASATITSETGQLSIISDVMPVKQESPLDITD